jgi:hypothetical protein
MKRAGNQSTTIGRRMFGRRAALGLIAGTRGARVVALQLPPKAAQFKTA